MSKKLSRRIPKGSYNDEVFGKKYNVQPNPYKGAQASVMARFGKQARNLAGVLGKGPAVAPTAKAMTENEARLSTLDLASQKRQSDAQRRLMTISSEMGADRIKSQREITQAKIDQSESTPLYEDIASVLTLTQNLHGLARNVGRASGGEADATFDEERYQENYDANIEKSIKLEGVEDAKSLSDDALQAAHDDALASARAGEGNIFNKAGRAVGSVIGGGIEAIPVVGAPMRRLRNQNIAEAEKTKVVQSKTMTPDQADKYYDQMVEHFDTMKNIYGENQKINPIYERLMMNGFTDLLNIVEYGLYDFEYVTGASQNFPIDESDTQPAIGE